MPRYYPAPEVKPLRQWSKWALLRAIAAAGGDAEALRPLSTEFLRSRLLVNVSGRAAKHVLNRTDLYALNEDALFRADCQALLREGTATRRAPSGFCCQMARK